MKNFFGVIEESKIILNETGKIIEKYWREIPNHYENIGIDEYVIMPNHLHGIIMIFEQKGKEVYFSKRTEQCSNPASDFRNKNYGILSKVIKSFKDITTKEIRNILVNSDFKWHRSYHDRIIRDENELNKIREYIFYNPVNFEFRKEKVFEENLYENL